MSDRRPELWEPDLSRHAHDRVRDLEVELQLEAICTAARRRNPEWKPWMREWCTRTNYGERRGIGWRARSEGIGRYGR